MLIWVVGFLFLFSCTASEDVVLLECQQNVGEACNKLGKNRTGKEAVSFFRRACDLGNTNGCVNLAEQIYKEDLTEARRVLKFSCDKGNTSACARFAELALEK